MQRSWVDLISRDTGHSLFFSVRYQCYLSSESVPVAAVSDHITASNMLQGGAEENDKREREREREKVQEFMR